MTKMVTLKEEYRNKRVSVGGTDYDFRFLSQERIQRVYDNNPHLRHMFEETKTISHSEISGKQSIPQQEITPEVFEELIKEAAKEPKRTKKR